MYLKIYTKIINIELVLVTIKIFSFSFTVFSQYI